MSDDIMQELEERKMTIPEQATTVMGENELDAIQWLEDTASDDESIQYAWDILKNYYELCKKELKSLAKKGIEEEISPFFKQQTQKEDESELKDIVGIVEEKIIKEAEAEEESPFLQKMFEVYENFFEPKMSKEEIIEKLKNIITRHKAGENITNEEKWFLAQICRLYNMQVKFGHSARVVFVAQYDFEEMMKDKVQTTEKAQLLKTIVLTSALLHDIGRFYQAAHFNTFKDFIMSEEEIIMRHINENIDSKMSPEDKKKLGIIDSFDHACAGYYFALASALVLQSQEIEEAEKRKKFVIDAIVAVVVRFHQISNSDMPEFDCRYSIEEAIGSDKDFPEELMAIYQYINQMYESSRAMAYETSDEIRNEERQFMSKFMSNFLISKEHYNGNFLVKEKKDFGNEEATEIFLLNHSGEVELQKEILRNLLQNNLGISIIDAEGLMLDENQKDITSILEQAQAEIEKIIMEFRQAVSASKNPEITMNVAEIENATIESIMIIIRKVSNQLRISLSHDTEEKLDEQVRLLLHEMQDYDIAKAIRDDFIQNTIIGQIPNVEMINFFITYPLMITTDADKVDIFNQRCLGIYPAPYHEQSFDIVPPPGKNLKEILTEYFCFKIDNPIVLDGNIIKVFNNMNNDTREMIKQYIASSSKELISIFDEHNKIRNNIEIVISNDEVIIKEDNTIKEILTDEPYKLFCEYNWNGFLTYGLDQYWKNQLTLKEIALKNSSGEEKEKLEQEIKNINVQLSNIQKNQNNPNSKIPMKLSSFFTISVPREVYDKNIRELSEEEQQEKTRRLITTEWLDRRFQRGMVNRNLQWFYPPEPETDEYKELFPDEEERMQLERDSMHLVSHSVTALIWQLNQFILVNMRSKQTMSFILDYKILDRIFLQYESKDPLIASILKDYLDYCKGFMAYVINSDKNDLLTAEDMAELRDAFAKNEPLHVILPQQTSDETKTTTISAS